LTGCGGRWASGRKRVAPTTTTLMPSTRREMGVGTEARSSDYDDPYAEYDGEDEDALDDDTGEEEDDEDDWSPSP